MKRSLDIVGAATLLVLLWPLMLMVALAVALEGGGPVIFRQTRIGLHGRPFTILKFRTMTVLENEGFVRAARAGDERLTRLGPMLRETGLDELPQLFNVLAGSMSLVGPRPHAAGQDLHFAACIPGYVERRRVRPGITGLAQVHGWRGGDDPGAIARRLAFDLRYIENRSLALDIEIALRTLPLLVRRAARLQDTKSEA